MKISVMLLIMGALLISGGVFDHAVSEACGSRGRAAFFLFALFCMNDFVLSPGGDASIGAASVLAVIWTAANAFSVRENRVFAMLMFPVVLMTGILTAPLASIGTETAAYSAGLLAVPTGLLLGERTGTAAAALIPVTACAICFMLRLPGNAGAAFELTEYCLTAQLTGFLAVIAVPEVKKTITRTNVRRPSAARPTRL